MANPEHLAKLKEGVEVWNSWRREHPGINPDLEEVNLGRADQSQVKLRGVNFKRTNLSKANLVGVDLHAANLTHASLSYANISRSYLREARLGNTNLNNAMLNYANLTYANLSHADLNHANLREANLSGANLFKTNLFNANLQKVGLLDTNFSYANLHNADLTGAQSQRTIFSFVDLSTTRGLDQLIPKGPSSIDQETLIRSKNLPEKFLRDCGFPDQFIKQLPGLVNSLEPIQFYSCFISYSSKDEPFAQRLHADLQAKGVRCWFAPEDMKIGDKIRPRIDEAIRFYDKLLLILSEESVNSDWVEGEVESAFEKEATRKKRDGVDETVLFPIRLDDVVMNKTSGWPAAIKRKRHIGDFTNWKDHDSYTKAFERLLKDLRASN